MNGKHLHNSQKLYYLEVMDEDGDRWAEWEWAEVEQEILNKDRFGVMLIDVRLATPSEANAWSDGYEESIGVGLNEERMANWNGVAYSITSIAPLVSKEVFTCGVCEDQYEIAKAASIGSFYLSVRTPKKDQANKTVLWHVCIQCSIR